MASITIRNLDEEVKTRLRVRATEHHRSMEEEARSFCARLSGARSHLKIWRALFAPELSRLEAWTWSCLRVNPDAGYHLSIDIVAAAVHTTAIDSHFDTGRVLL